MVLAIDITDGRGLSSEVRRELLLKKEQGDTVLAFLFAVNYRLTSCTLLTRRIECFSFKSGCDVRVSKLIKEGWPMVLW